MAKKKKYKTIEETLYEQKFIRKISPLTRLEVLKVMKECAKQVAIQVREECAKSAKMIRDGKHKDIVSAKCDLGEYRVDTDAILRVDINKFLK